MSKQEPITRTRAAKILGVKPKTLESYICKKYLTKIVMHGRIYVDKTEVEALKNGMNNPVPDVSGIIINKITAILKEQQKDIEVIKRVLDMYNEPLDMGDQSILALYKAAIELDIQSWPENWVEEWTSTIIRMRCEDFFQLEKLTNDENPWRPFLKIMMIIQDLLRKNKEFEKLTVANSARGHIDSLIKIWCEVKSRPNDANKLNASDFGKIAIGNIRERYLKSKYAKK